MTLKYGSDQYACCAILPSSDLGLFTSVQGYGSFYYPKKSRQRSGIFLSIHWYLNFRKSTQSNCDSVDSFRAKLERANIELCAHKRNTDADVLATLFGMVSPEGELADLIDRYIAEEAGIRCGRCDTKILIGKGEHTCQRLGKSVSFQGKTACKTAITLSLLVLDPSMSMFASICKDERDYLLGIY